MTAIKPLRNKRVTLHIGLPKTATSSLQSVLASNYSQCMDAGLCYPNTMRTSAGFRFHRPLYRTAKMLPKKDFVAEYQSVLDEAGGRDILFSCEEINLRLIKRHNPVLRFLNRIHGTENVQILITLRNVYDFADSLMAQFYRGTLFGIDPYDLAQAGNLNPEGFFAAAEAAYGFPIYSYLGYINGIKAHFPENEIRLVSIEKNDLNEPYLDFLAKYLGLGGRFASQAGEAVNVRQSNQLLMCLREARHHLRNTDFNDLRPMIAAYCATQKRPELETRNSYLHINDAIRAEISHVAEAEKSKLLPLMDTPGTALYENKPVLPVEDIELPQAMKKRIKQISNTPRPVQRITNRLSVLRRKVLG